MAQTGSSADLLTKRQREVLQLCCEGKTSQEMAEELQISRKTVNWHIGRIHEKLQVSNSVQLLLRALGLGLITID